MPRKKLKRAKKWSMYPSLHGAVSTLLRQDGIFFDFHNIDDSDNCVKDYDTNIMGRFTCRNSECTSGGWQSKQIAITIRMYPQDRYNARVYYQRCKDCNRLSKPQLNDSYTERIAYRIKKWHGLQMDEPPYSGKSKGPHRIDLCEGCNQGHCTGG